VGDDSQVVFGDSGFAVKEAQVGHSVAYKFNMEKGKAKKEKEKKMRERRGEQKEVKSWKKRWGKCVRERERKGEKKEKSFLFGRCSVCVHNASCSGTNYGIRKNVF
jgi:hypothetical protein